MKSDLIKDETLTLGHDDEPTLTIMLGHVKADAFNKAYKKEGWTEEGEWLDSDLTHGWACWVDEKFVQSEVKTDEADEPYTWVGW